MEMPRSNGTEATSVEEESTGCVTGGTSLWRCVYTYKERVKATRVVEGPSGWEASTGLGKGIVIGDSVEEEDANNDVDLEKVTSADII